MYVRVTSIKPVWNTKNIYSLLAGQLFIQINGVCYIFFLTYVLSGNLILNAPESC